MRIALLGMYAVALLGCSNPGITDISDSSLKVQYYSWSKPAEIQAEADRGCKVYGKKAVFINNIAVRTGLTSEDTFRLFACN